MHKMPMRERMKLKPEYSNNLLGYIISSIHFEVLHFFLRDHRKLGIGELLAFSHRLSAGIGVRGRGGGGGAFGLLQAK